MATDTEAVEESAGYPCCFLRLRELTPGIAYVVMGEDRQPDEDALRIAGRWTAAMRLF